MNNARRQGPKRTPNDLCHAPLLLLLTSFAHRVLTVGPVINVAHIWFMQFVQCAAQRRLQPSLRMGVSASTPPIA